MKQNNQLPQFKNNFQKNDTNPLNRFNKYFEKKYDDNLPLIRQLQQQRDQLQTPFLNAQKNLKEIIESEEISRHLLVDIQLEHSHNVNKIKQNKVQKNEANNQFLNYEQAQSIYFDLSKLVQLEEILQQIINFAIVTDQQVVFPDFQSYWNIFFCLSLERLSYLCSNKQWKANIDLSLFLNVCSISFFQCISLKLHEFPQIASSDIFVAISSQIKTLLNLSHQNLLIISGNILTKVSKQHEQNIYQTCLSKIILMKKIRNFNDNDLFELRKNNEIIQNHLNFILNSQLETKNNRRYISICNQQIQKQQQFIQQKTQQFDSQLESIIKNVYHFQEIAPVIYSQSQIDLDNFSAQEEQEIIEIPFLPQRTEQQLKEKPYTLVLDLDETLGHYNTDTKKFLQRPGLSKFLADVFNYYEVVLFTAGLKIYADSVIPSIDKKEYISHKLYRQHCKLQGRMFIKDLSCIGRDLSKVIIIDNNLNNFKLQQENAIFITSWYSDQKDTELLELSKILIKLAKSKSTDLRWALQKYRDHIIRQISNGVQNPLENI